MEEENGDPTTPFWLQTSNTLYRHRNRRSSSLLLNPVLLIVLLPTIALLLLFLVVPSLLSFASQTFKPNSVKRNWDLLNLLLVLFAVACGFLNKRNDDTSSSSSSSITDEANNGVAASISQGVSENPLQSTIPRRQWFEYSSDPRIYDSVGNTSPDSISTNMVRLRRSCSSYPDLRQECSWVSGNDDRWRFFDDNDIDLNTYRSASEYVRRRRGRQPESEHSEIKTIPVDTFVRRPITETLSSASPTTLPPSPSPFPTPAEPPAPPPQRPPPPPPPLPAMKKETSRTFHSVERKKKVKNSEELVSEIKRSRPLPPSSPPPPPPPPPPVMKHKTSRSFYSAERKEKLENAEEVVSEIKRSRPLQPSSSQPPPPPPPPPRPASHHHRSEQKSGRNEKKRVSGAKDIANSLASLYHQRKKKKKQKQKQNCKDNQCSPDQSPPPLLHPGRGELLPPSPPPQPPPPPPPPPASIFHNLFSYKNTSKSKRIHSISISQLDPSPPPPPPPPPRPWSLSRSIKRKSQSKAPEQSSDPPRQRQTSSTGSRRPPLPAKTSSLLYDGEENLSSGGQSPLIPIPPPPPPRPPFRMPELKFIVRGDFARIQSNQNSRSSSPVSSPTMKESEYEPESYVSVSSTSTSASTTTMMDGGDGSGGVFCPSPDVNTKAETFIARFRAGLRLEKMNSIKEKQEAQGPSPSHM